MKVFFAQALLLQDLCASLSLGELDRIGHQWRQVDNLRGGQIQIAQVLRVRRRAKRVEK
jgi:hypothetical protein